MNRIAGLEKSQAPWHLRWFYTTMRKMFGKDMTPVKMLFDVGSDEFYKPQMNADKR